MSGCECSNRKTAKQLLHCPKKKKLNKKLKFLMIVIHIVHIIYTSVPLARLHNFSLAFSLSICPFVVGNGMIVIRIL